MLNEVWAWLHNPNYEFKSFIAVTEERAAVGLAHYRLFFRPLSATVGGFIDVFFVTPSARSSAISKDLIETVTKAGKQKMVGNPLDYRRRQLPC